jgi:hypothetical protein
MTNRFTGSREVAPVFERESEGFEEHQRGVDALRGGAVLRSIHPQTSPMLDTVAGGHLQPLSFLHLMNPRSSRTRSAPDRVAQLEPRTFWGSPR